MILAERQAAEIDGDFVVFLIGVLIVTPRKVHKWWPVMAAMPRFGLAAAGESVPASGRRETARGRLTGQAAAPGVNPEAGSSS